MFPCPLPPALTQAWDTATDAFGKGFKKNVNRATTQVMMKTGTSQLGEGELGGGKMVGRGEL